MAKFTKQMSEAVHKMPPPYHGLVVDFVEMNGYIGIRVYENQIMSFSDERRVVIMEYLQKLRNIIEAFGERCYFDGAVGDPPRGTR